MCWWVSGLVCDSTLWFILVKSYARVGVLISSVVRCELVDSSTLIVDNLFQGVQVTLYAPIGEVDSRLVGNSVVDRNLVMRVVEETDVHGLVSSTSSSRNHKIVPLKGTVVTSCMRLALGSVRQVGVRYYTCGKGKHPFDNNDLVQSRQYFVIPQPLLVGETVYVNEAPTFLTGRDNGEAKFEQRCRVTAIIKLGLPVYDDKVWTNYWDRYFFSLRQKFYVGYLYSHEDYLEGCTLREKWFTDYYNKHRNMYAWDERLQKHLFMVKESEEFKAAPQRGKAAFCGRPISSPSLGKRTYSTSCRSYSTSYRLIKYSWCTSLVLYREIPTSLVLYRKIPTSLVFYNEAPVPCSLGEVGIGVYIELDVFRSPVSFIELPVLVHKHPMLERRKVLPLLRLWIRSSVDRLDAGKGILALMKDDKNPYGLRTNISSRELSTWLHDLSVYRTKGTWEEELTWLEEEVSKLHTGLLEVNAESMKAQEALRKTYYHEVSVYATHLLRERLYQISIPWRVENALSQISWVGDEHRARCVLHWLRYSLETLWWRKHNLRGKNPFSKSSHWKPLRDDQETNRERDVALIVFRSMPLRIGDAPLSKGEEIEEACV